MSNRKIDPLNLSVGDIRRIEFDLNGFGATSFSGTDFFLMRGGPLAAGIARQRLLDAFHMLEDGLNAPEAAPATTAFCGRSAWLTDRRLAPEEERQLRRPVTGIAGMRLRWTPATPPPNAVQQGSEEAG